MSERGARRQEPQPVAARLQVQDLSTAFRTPAGLLLAVDAVSLELEAGETLGIVGESGSGKSVLARSIMDLLPPTAIRSGSVVFDGRELSHLPARERHDVLGKGMAMVFQDPITSLNPVVRVGREITESLRRHEGMSRAEARTRALDLMVSVGIAEPERRFRAYPHEMSGGMCQRLGIAVAIACSPNLLIADEPTTALDVTIQRQILDLLAELQRSKQMSMVLITHDLGVVAGRTDAIAVMYAGRIVEQAPTSTLFREARHPYTEGLLGSSPRIGDPSHTRLLAIPGRPPEMTEKRLGCAFAPRCRYAQPRCLAEAPVLAPTHTSVGHRVACFYPAGTESGNAALGRNVEAGRTAAGLPVRQDAGVA